MKKRKDNEKNRKLSYAEERRLEHFNQVSSSLEAKGYRKKELTVGIVKANFFALILAVPVWAAAFIIFFMINSPETSLGSLSVLRLVIVLIAMIVLVPVHELIHGLSWGLFAENHMRDIEYGFMKEYMTPYCTCKVPLKLPHYLTGALMPLIILGIIPTAAAILTGSFLTLLLGLTMIVAAAGDIMIAARLITYNSDYDEILIYDHPTQAGSVVFERNNHV